MSGESVGTSANDLEAASGAGLSFCGAASCRRASSRSSCPPILTLSGTASSTARLFRPRLLLTHLASTTAAARRRSKQRAALSAEPARTLPMNEPSAIRRAVEKGVAYLESAQLPSGEIPIEISPTPEMNGECVLDSAVFPAALAARALSITPSAARLRSRALDFLLREMNPEGLWCYPCSESPHYDYVPLDTDDTAIASTALAAAGRRFPNNRALLLAQRERN